MTGAATLLLVALATGIQWGWQPMDKGGIEYIVQVEPQLVDSFRKEGFTSEIPPGMRDIRRIRIVVGDGAVPHQGEVLQPAVATNPPVHAAEQAADITPPKRLPDGVPSLPLKSGVTGEMARTASAAEPPKAGGSTEPAHDAAPAAPTAASPASQRPWLALLAVVGGLVVSLSGNVYLGWVHWGTRSRYLGLVRQMRGETKVEHPK
jgi:hypothetical protein